MSKITTKRRITFDEAIAEMDRRGEVIERLEARIEDMDSVLLEALTYVADDLRQTLECFCVLDPQTHEPILETMTEDERPHVDKIRAVLARIDAMLGNRKPEGSQ